MRSKIVIYVTLYHQILEETVNFLLTSYKKEHQTNA